MDRRDLSDDPLVQIGGWLGEARDAGEFLPQAMALATATADGTPSVRMVLLDSLEGGLAFYTDLESQKAAELHATGRAAVVLHWQRPEHRQVRAAGTAERLPDEAADRYWAGRPRDFHLSVLVSRQDEILASRDVLPERARALGEQFPEGVPIPRPERWGGFCMAPTTVELWEERPDRLNDRFRYRREGDRWLVERLAP